MLLHIVKFGMFSILQIFQDMKIVKKRIKFQIFIQVNVGDME